MEEEKNTAGWVPVGIDVEGGAILIHGISPWEHPWISTHSSVELFHPDHPQQREVLQVYRIKTPTAPITFAAGELSVGIFGFFAQPHPMTAPRRLWSFGLRTLFVVVTVFGVAIAWPMHVVHHRNQLIAWLEASGGEVQVSDCDRTSPQSRTWPPSPCSEPRPWFFAAFGDKTIGQINLDAAKFSDADKRRIKMAFPEAAVVVLGQQQPQKKTLASPSARRLASAEEQASAVAIRMAMQGAWVVAETDGRRQPDIELGVSELRIVGSQVFCGVAELPLTFEIDARHSPAHIDFMMPGSTDTDRLLGIVEVDESTLKLAYGLRRPALFDDETLFSQEFVRKIEMKQP